MIGDVEYYDLGPMPRLLLFLRDGPKKGGELSYVMHYRTALNTADKLIQAGLVNLKIEQSSKGKEIHLYSLTKTGQEVADLLEKINEIIIKNMEKK